MSTNDLMTDEGAAAQQIVTLRNLVNSVEEENAAARQLKMVQGMADTFKGTGNTLQSHDWARIAEIMRNHFQWTKAAADLCRRRASENLKQQSSANEAQLEVQA